MSKTRILFLCYHNSARSQMAEGLLRHFYGEKYEVFSAGSNPTQVHPLAIKVMAEIGIDISKQTSKSIEEFRSKNIDLVISVCKSRAKIACPICSSPMLLNKPEIVSTELPKAKHYLHHAFDDPSEVEGTDEEKIAAFRRIRDEIKKWILESFGRSIEDLQNNPTI